MDEPASRGGGPPRVPATAVERPRRTGDGAHAAASGTLPRGRREESGGDAQPDARISGGCAPRGGSAGLRHGQRGDYDPPDEDTVELKLKLLGEARYVRLKMDELSVQPIAAKFDQGFNLTASVDRYVFQWCDKDGDWIPLEDSPGTRKHFLKALKNRPNDVLTIRGRCTQLQEDRDRATQMATMTLTDQLSSCIMEGSRGCIKSLADRYMEVINAFSKLNHLVVQLSGARRLLFVTKPGDPAVARITRKMSLWLVGTFPSTTVLMDEWLRECPDFECEGICHDVGENARDRIRFWKASAEDAQLRHNSKGNGFDLMITVGGDGTVLHAAWLFQGPSPPIMSFHMGSLGFLTVFDIGTFRESLSSILEGGGVRLNLRMRLACSLYRGADPCELKGSLKKTDEGSPTGDGTDEISLTAHEVCVKRHEIFDKDGAAGRKPEAVFHVLNELVVDRGANPSMVQLELFVDNIHLTTVLADGLVVATSTGSTAYSLAAGGSLVHPEKDTVLVTPICPHTLTCRPFQLPCTRNLRICVPSASRTTGWASFDGRFRQELSYGDSIVVSFSPYPITTVCREDPSRDWFRSLERCLNWNDRKRQKPFSASQL